MSTGTWPQQLGAPFCVPGQTRSMQEPCQNHHHNKTTTHAHTHTHTHTQDNHHTHSLKTHTTNHAQPSLVAKFDGSTTTTLGFEAKPLRVSQKERTSGPRTAGVVHGRGAAVKTTPLRSSPDSCSALACPTASFVAQQLAEIPRSTYARQSG